MTCALIVACVLTALIAWALCAYAGRLDDEEEL